MALIVKNIFSFGSGNTENAPKLLKQAMDRIHLCIDQIGIYCKFGNFCENFIFGNSIKTHICDVKNPQQWRDLPISVIKRVISPIREGFIFEKLRMRM